jgi:peptidoglycan/LPS O-acetylase OafA/YrhL
VANSTGRVVQPGIAGLLTDNPWGRATGNRQFNGSLWSIGPEISCYVIIGVLSLVAVLRRARIAVVGAVVAGVAAIALHPSFIHPALTSAGAPQGVHLASLADRDTRILAVVVVCFLVGASAQLYRARLPLRFSLACGAAVVVGVTIRFGGFAVVGVPAYAYLLIAGAHLLPARLRRIGRDNDYSYGLYIYGAVVQQLISLYGGYRWGPVLYTLAAAVIAAILAVASWKAVERPALRCKGWSPMLHRRAPRSAENRIADLDAVDAQRVVRSDVAQT